MQPKKTPETRRKYDRTGEPADFKTEVLKMLDSGQTAAYVANALGVSENLICRWKSEASPGPQTQRPVRFIECCYNRVRQQSSMGCKSPEQVENEYHSKPVS